MGKDADPKTALVPIEEGHHTVVQEVGDGERGLATVQLRERRFGTGVDEGLLVDAPDPLHSPDIERILRAAVAGTLALEPPMCFLFGLGLLERGKLALGQGPGEPRTWAPTTSAQDV